MHSVLILVRRGGMSCDLRETIPRSSMIGSRNPECRSLFHPSRERADTTAVLENMARDRKPETESAYSPPGSAVGLPEALEDSRQFVGVDSSPVSRPSFDMGIIRPEFTWIGPARGVNFHLVWRADSRRLLQFVCASATTLPVFGAAPPEFLSVCFFRACTRSSIARFDNRARDRSGYT